MKWNSLFDLFVFDLDGTALGGYDPYQRLPDRFCRFLDALAECGVRWCTNSTWHPESQAELAECSALKSRPAFLYGRTGLLRGAFNAADGRRFELDRAFEIEARSMESGFDATLDRLAQRLRGDPGLAGHVRVVRLDGEPLMAQVEADEGCRARALAVVTAALERAPHVSLDVDMPPGQVLIRARLMNKGAAVGRMQHDLGVVPERTLAAADGWNDLPMLDPRIAGLQICPSNAIPEVKQCVLTNGGCVGRREYSDGVIGAAGELLRREPLGRTLR